MDCNIEDFTQEVQSLDAITDQLQQSIIASQTKFGSIIGNFEKR